MTHSILTSPLRVFWERRKPWNDPWDEPLDVTPRKSKIPLPVTYSGWILVVSLVFFVFSILFPTPAYGYLALNSALVLGRPWTLITHIFLHANFDHLLWNMLFLFFFGMDLERRIGERRFLGLFLVSGLAAGLGEMAVSPGFILGASGALYGVMGCLAMIAPEIRVLLFFIIPMRIQWAVLLFAFLDFTMMGTGDNIAHVAHLIGLLVGLGYGNAIKGRYRSWD